jgi:hypothetical protein
LQTYLPCRFAQIVHRDVGIAPAAGRVIDSAIEMAGFHLLFCGIYAPGQHFAGSSYTCSGKCGASRYYFNGFAPGESSFHKYRLYWIKLLHF